MIRAILISLLLAAAAAGQEFRVISDPFDAGNVSITGGSIDGVTLGAASVTINDNVTLYGDGGEALSIRNGGFVQNAYVYNKYTDGANYSRLKIAGNGIIESQAAGSGTQQTTYLRGAAVRLQTGASNTDALGCFGSATLFYGNARPNTTAATDLGSGSAYWRSLYLSSSTIFSSGTQLLPNGDGGLIVRNAALSSRLTLDSSGNLTPAGNLRRTVTAGITASTTQTQGQGALTAWLNEVSTVANANDTVTLPTAVAGMEVVVCNNGANTLQIFPASGDNLGAGLNTATTLAAGSNVTYVSYDATNWEVK